MSDLSSLAPTDRKRDAAMSLIFKKAVDEGRHMTDKNEHREHTKRIGTYQEKAEAKRVIGNLRPAVTAFTRGGSVVGRFLSRVRRAINMAKDVVDKP